MPDNSALSVPLNAKQLFSLFTRLINHFTFCHELHFERLTEVVIAQNNEFHFGLCQTSAVICNARSYILFTGRPYRGKPSDMWALGVVLFTMLYGQFPFYDSIPQELFRKIKAAEYSIPE